MNYDPGAKTCPDGLGYLNEWPIGLEDLQPHSSQNRVSMLTGFTNDSNMFSESNIAWVIRFRSNETRYLYDLRRASGLHILADREFLWLRGDSSDASLARRIQSIPGAEWFAIGSDEQLTRRDETVPCERLPVGRWMPLLDWLDLKLPTAGFAPRVQERVMLKLVRSNQLAEANCLQTNWQVWHDYALTAPQIRLNQLGFAVSIEAKVLIRGKPVPPIPGQRFSESDGVIVPVGWRFEPDIEPLAVRQVLELDDSEMALFSQDGSYERLPESAFVQATRSAVRLTHGS
jgi:hypothetical protein